MHKTIQALLALLTIGSLISLAQEPTGFRANTEHTGIAQTNPPKSIDHIRWEFKTGSRIVASPVVSAGIVYIGSDDHALHAIDADSGHELWRFATEANVGSTVAVDHNSVFFLSLDGNAYCLDAKTGKLNWKFKTEGESRLNAAGLYGLLPTREVIPDPWDFYLSSPTVAEGTVYFGSGDHHIYALDASSGHLRWKYQTNDVVHSSPAISKGVLYVGCWDGILYAINAKSGHELWKFATGVDPTHFMQGIPGSPAVAEGIVAFGSRDGLIYALEAVSGKLLWHQENSGSWVIASPAIQNGVLYITTSDSLKFRALDLKTGKPIYDLLFNAYSFSSPTIAGRHAYFGSFDGCVFDVDLEAHQYNSHFCVKAHQNRRDLLTEEGHLKTEVIFGPLGPDGKLNNTIDASIIGIDRLLQLGSILSSPTVENGVVYFGSTDGSVYALD